MKSGLPEYDPSYAARVHDLCMAGLSEVEMANVLGLSVGMMRAWRERYIDFDNAWLDGTLHANIKVLAALHKRACGYEKVVWKETQFGMMREQKHIEPSVPACLAWLSVKMPDQWGKVGQDLPPGGGKIPVDSMSEQEAARRVAFALAKALFDQSRGIENGNADTSKVSE